MKNIDKMKQNIVKQIENMSVEKFEKVCIGFGRIHEYAKEIDRYISFI